MKACIIQPPYSRDLSKSEEYFEFKIDQLAQCDDSIDLIVLPEYSDVPCATTGREDTIAYHKQNIDRLLTTCAETARRCNAVVFVNALFETATGYRNTTYAFDRSGTVVGKYFKKHLPPLELFAVKLDDSYLYEYEEPYVLEIDGVRYGFLTCYDFYFYEEFPQIARQNVDVIIGCSLQRSDSHDAIEIMCRFLAYNCNAYVLRSSVSMDPNSTICGASMAVTPKGEVLANLRSEIGRATVDFDPHAKYYKPAGYGNPDAPHYEYIEFGRQPWQYRPAGSATIRDDAHLPYPRVCAHQGFRSIAPENSMIAYGAAVGAGAEEIECDLWVTADGEIVSCHDENLERVSNGKGNIREKTFAELQQLDFGVKYGENFIGLRILRLEDILKKFSRQVILNLHLKTPEELEAYDETALKKILRLLDTYDCRKHVYFMCNNDALLRQVRALAPDLSLCCGEREAVIEGREPSRIVERAVALGCQKVQLRNGYFTRETVEQAHAKGLICNVCAVNTPAEAKLFREMGIDTFLTDEYQVVAHALKK